MYNTWWRPLALFLLIVFGVSCDDTALVGPQFDSGTLAGREVQLPTKPVIPIERLLDGAIVVSKNPSGLVPLSAEMTLKTRIPARVSTRVLGDGVTGSNPTEAATEHSLPILGFYPGRENLVEITLDTDAAVAFDTIQISSDPLPEFFPEIEVTVAEEARMEPGWTYSSLSLANGGHFRTMPIIFDRSGVVRWYLDLTSLGDLASAEERLSDGNLLVGLGHGIYEFDMLGNEVRRWNLPGYWQHHDLTEKPDGNLIVAVRKSGISTVDDHIVELDGESGMIVREWDIREILDVHRRDFSDSETDWFHMNSVWYDDIDDCLIVSGRNQGVIKVTMDNQLVWILAPHLGWGAAGVNQDGHDTSEFLLTAVDAAGQPLPDGVQTGEEGTEDFRWSWGQHAAMILPNRNLFLFDNGATRNFTAGGPTFSRGVEYAVDETNMTVRQVWQYGESRGSTYYSPIISDVDLLPETGNRLVMPGVVPGSPPRAFVTEVTYPAREVVFEAEIRFKNQLGTGEFDWGEFDIVFRSERMSLYPDVAGE